MLINLNEEICGYVAERLVARREATSDAPSAEYYLARLSADGRRRCLLYVTDSAEAAADECARHSEAEVCQAGDLTLVAVSMADDTDTLADVLQQSVMSWDVALPLFYEIITSRLAAGSGSDFARYALTPGSILISKDGDTYHAATTLLPHWDEDVTDSTTVNTYLAPELEAGELPGSFASWVFSAAMLLTAMIQSTPPWKPEQQHDLPEDARENYRALVSSSAPHVDAIGSLRKLISSNLSPAPDMRASSPREFLAAIYSIIEEKEMPLPRKYDMTDDNTADHPDDYEEPARSKPENRQPKVHVNSDEPDEMPQQRNGEPRLKIDFKRAEGNGFSDVAGLDDIKAKMTRNFISIVKNPDMARTFRIEPPNGMLLWGPPGNGKSFISRKLAEESGLIYATVNPGDLGSIFIHGTQGLIAELFTKCERIARREKSGVLLVLEEFDSLVPSRSAAGGDTNSRNDEVAEFLTRLNNCAQKGVYVVATTNRIDAIDPAVMRKGRMDEVIYVDLPDEQVRTKLFQLELTDRPHEDLDLNRLVKMTDGFSSGDIAYLVKESARKAFEQTIAAPDKKIVAITQQQLESTIGCAHPSVTAAERRRYEKLRDSYDRHRRELPRVGF